MEKFKKITEDNFDDFIEDSYDNWLANRVKTFFIGINVDNESDLQYSQKDKIENYALSNQFFNAFLIKYIMAN